MTCTEEPKGFHKGHRVASEVEGSGNDTREGISVKGCRSKRIICRYRHKTKNEEERKIMERGNMLLYIKREIHQGRLTLPVSYNQDPVHVSNNQGNSNRT